MKIKSDFTIQPVGSFYTAIAVGETSKTFHAMIRLNETGAFLWKLMAEKDCTEAELTDAILAEYDVDRETVEADVHRIVASLAEAGVFEAGTEPAR
ncbi:MAG: PqqD family protein [Ruminococcaceae bacterium]|nr:PqqD family protein [Oscillospiraceae bacterium]